MLHRRPLINRGRRASNNPIPARAPSPSIPRQGPRAPGRRQDQSNASPAAYIDAPSPEDSQPFPATILILQRIFRFLIRKARLRCNATFGPRALRQRGERVLPVRKRALDICQSPAARLAAFIQSPPSGGQVSPTGLGWALRASRVAALAGFFPP